MTPASSPASREGCTPESGTCPTCRGACDRKPGWFRPGEAERTAELLGLSLGEFFGNYLTVDWWEDGTQLGSSAQDVFLLSPAIIGDEPGTEFPAEPGGRCVFFQDGACRIHQAKPAECREYWCGHPNPRSIHREVARSWVAHQQQIRELLGREPVAAAYEPHSAADLFGRILGGW